MKTLAQCILILFLGISLAACDGDDPGGGFTGTGAQPGSNGGTTAPGAPPTSGDTTPGDSTGTSEDAVSFGSGSGDSFKPGVLAIAIPTLSAGGSTTIRATLVNLDQTPWTGNAEVTFTSNCVQLGLASMQTTATVTNGAAVTTYTNLGCANPDNIVARVTINNSELTANGQINALDMPHFAPLAISPTDLAADGKATITAKLVNADGSAFAGDAQITFTSDCIAAQQAAIESPIDVRDGKAVTTYTAQGCVGDDEITATFQVGERELQATGTITVADSVLFGSGTGSGFHEGELQFGYGISKLSAGGSTEIRATMVNDDLTPYTGSGTVVFTSYCLSQFKATISPTTATIVNGGVKATYTNINCDRADTVTAHATFNSDHRADAMGQLVTSYPIRFGNGSPVSFVDGKLALGDAEILADGSTDVTANLINADGTPFVGDALVQFTSTCAERGEATIESPVTVSEGAVVATYTANGCFGTDRIIASFKVGDAKTLTAASDITIASAVRLGRGLGSAFENKQLTVGVGTGTLSAGGSTSVQATLVNADDYTPFNGAATVAFTSSCAASGDATFVSPVTVVNGIAESTYTARGCVGPDVITATTNVDGPPLTATGSVSVAAPTAGSITFVSAEPTVISYRGSGGTETSTVIFKVLDSVGEPLANQAVDFKLGSNTSLGDITFGNGLTTTSKKSGADGTVAVTLHAGTVHTSVRVKASIAGSSPLLTSQSSKLAISTGIADADSFSIGAETLNPESYLINGKTDRIVVHLADRFNNPVPDGTAVAFTTEGGSIEPQCFTGENAPHGSCSVIWTSGKPWAGGRVTILAYVIGEENFIDVDGSGTYSSGDIFDSSMNLGEPYEDDDEDGQYDTNEFYYNFYKEDQIRTPPDSNFEGIQCEYDCGPDGVSTGNFTIGLGASVVLVMSGSEANISISPSCPSDPPNPITLPIATNSFELYVKDQNCHVMPAGTTVRLMSNNSIIIGESLLGKVFTVHNKIPRIGQEGVVPPFTVSLHDVTADSTISVTVTTPSGVETTSSITFN